VSDGAVADLQTPASWEPGCSAADCPLAFWDPRNIPCRAGAHRCAAPAS